MTDDSTAEIETAPTAGAPGEKERRRFPWSTVVVVAIILAVLGGYAAVAALASGRIASGTTVLGVDVGGMGREEAVAALEPAAAEVEQADLAISHDDRSATLVPAEAGLGLDVEATVDGLLGFSLNPADIARAFRGSDTEVAPAATVDDAALTSALEGAADTFAVAPEDAAVELTDAGASAVPATEGVELDVAATATEVSDAWPTESVEAVVTVAPPALRTEDADAFADSLNSTQLADEVTLTGPNGDAVVTPAQMLAHGTVSTDGGGFSYDLDGEALAAALESATPDLVNEPSPASFSFDAAHQLSVVESRPGREIDPAPLGDAVIAAAKTETRSGELPYRETEAEVNNDTLGVTDFSEIVSSFETPLPYNPTRTKNLVRAGELITGTVVQPGERFDLTDVLAPITAENGYFAAGIIVNGIHTEGFGGGLSQVATTTYNAGYFAGMKDIDHRPHTVWFERYPAGRESTMFIGSINMVFENTTPYALVMSAYVHDGKFHTDIWSTPHFEVKTYASPKTNIQPITTVDLDDEDCEPYPGGEDGFTITNTREVYLEGELVDESSYTWTYRPDNAVRCV